MRASSSAVMRDGVARTRATDAAVTKCDTAWHGFVQPFSGVGMIGTDKLGSASSACSVNGTRITAG